MFYRCLGYLPGHLHGFVSFFPADDGRVEKRRVERGRSSCGEDEMRWDGEVHV